MYKFTFGYLVLFAIYIIGSANICYTQRQISGKEIKNTIWNNKNIEYVDGEIAVKLKKGYAKTLLNPVLLQHKAKIKQDFDEMGWGWIELLEGADIIQVIDSLKKLPMVDIAEPNSVTHINVEPNDPHYLNYKQWSLMNIGSPILKGSTAGADIKANQAWDIATGNPNVILAILDTGIPIDSLTLQLCHPDLDDTNKIILGPDFIDDPIEDSIDYLQGVRDRSGHGTHVAGIASSETNNGIGVAGVAWNCKLMIIQVFDRGGWGTPLSFYNGVKYAVDYYRNNPTKRVIINYSGGGSYPSQPAYDAVNYANTYGVTIVASAGNAYRSEVRYPAAYSTDFSNVIAVSSSTWNDTLSMFSSIGTEVNIAAPGGYGYTIDYYGRYYYDKPNNIYSTTPPYNCYLASNTDLTPYYGYLAGTSMAAPQVTGVVGLLLSVNPYLLPNDIRNIIQQTADKVGNYNYNWDPANPDHSKEFGYGRINAYRAVFQAPSIHLTAQVNSNWNMLGLPVIPLSFAKSAVWGDAISSALTWEGGPYYVSKDTVENRVGYWLNYPSNQTVNYFGVPKDSFHIGVRTDWNMIGSLYSDIHHSQITPVNTTISSSYFGFNGGYFPTDVIEAGKGYWIKVSQAGELYMDKNTPPSGGDLPCVPQPPNPSEAPAVPFLNLPSNGATGVSITPTLNWYSSTGATSYRLQVATDNCFDDLYYDYPNITTISKQTGTLSYSTTYYWRVNASNSIATSNWSLTRSFTTQSAPGGGTDPCDPYSSILSLDQLTVSDANGNAQTLYVGNQKKKFNLGFNDFEMPPFTPKGAFKANFHSKKFIETVPPDKSEIKLPIKIKDAAYPLILSWNTKSDNKITYWISKSDKKDDKIKINGSGSMAVNTNTDDDLIIIAQAIDPCLPQVDKIVIQDGVNELQKNVSVEYALEQNTPNPFNPSTVIEYSLPEAAHVILKVYNTLGEEITTLIDGMQDAGYKAVRFDANYLANGVYFYRLQARSPSTSSGRGFIDVKKMLLVK